MPRSQLIVVAGPNGAGKSTYSRTAFNRGFLLLDPDRYGVASGEADTVFGVGRAVIRRVRAALSSREDFVLETTLSGRFPLDLLERAKQQGYDTPLIYVGIDDVRECIRRIALRVRQGGHSVPESDVRRRLPRSITNLVPALRYTDRALILDNGSQSSPYRTVAELEDGVLKLSKSVPQWAITALNEL